LDEVGSEGVKRKSRDLWNFQSFELLNVLWAFPTSAQPKVKFSNTKSISLRGTPIASPKFFCISR
jgi:hypothetical protein